MLHTKTKGIIGTIILIFMAGWLVGLGSPAAVAAGTDYNELAAQAVQNNYQLFQSGAAVDGGWGNFGAYDAYILTQAGVDTETWVGENGSFKSAAIDLIDASLNNEATAAKSSSKRMAQDYLAAKSLGESDKASQLLKILQDRQGASGNGSFDANAFSDIPAFEMLGRAGDIGRIDAAAAIAYLLGEQDSSGAWTSSWQDFMATAEAIRALEYLKPYAEEQQLEVVNTAINKGCDWLKLRQISNGGFQDGSGFDDPVVDTSEATFTLLCLGIDPGSWTTTDGKSPLDYLKDEAPNADGTFGSYANIASNTWILDAYWQLGARLGLIIDPASSVLTVGGTRQLAATFCDPDGTFADVTGLASWSVDDADIAAVSQGLVTGVKVGKTGIHALYNGSSAAAVIQVNSSGDSTNPGQDSIIKVYIQVVGQNNDIL
ncbi:MAG: Ig-like domain-containing protein, partial [Syntrophomonas sp.]